jgi:hypothetical protein
MHAAGGAAADAWAALLRARAFYRQGMNLFWHALVWNTLCLVARAVCLEALLHAAEAWLLRCCARAPPRHTSLNLQAS